jgi:peptide chain release factor 1
MFSKLDEVDSRYEEVNMQLQRPDVAANQKQYRAFMKELSDLEKIVVVYREFKRKKADLKSNKEMLATETDSEMREMAKEEIKQLESDLVELEARLKILLIPKDPNDDKNIILEIRAGAGGDEASLFAEEMFRGYVHYASNLGWKVDMMSFSEGNVGGAKEIVASISGESVYSKLKYESGVHRVQRVPKTEAAGRIHTSTVTVAVLPEAEDVEIKILDKDLRIDVYRSGGPGGQSVNTTDSAVRITHLPTGTVVSCQNEKSQIQNKAAAMRVLQSRLLEIKRREEEAKKKSIAGDVKASWGEQMRSYVMAPYQMVKDLRTDYEVNNPSGVFDGDLDGFIAAGIRWRKQTQN